MSNYQVADIRRIHTESGLRMVASHNHRDTAYTEDGKVREDYPHLINHPENRIYNECHCDPDEVLKARRDRIEAAKVHRKPQKNAARAFEITMSASPEWFQGRSVEEAKELFKAGRDYFAKRFGAEQIIGWSTHFDETTPHMHVVLVPLVNDPKRGWKYASGEFVGGRAGLYTFHDELAQALKPFGVERGERGKGAEHTDLQGWKRELERREKELDRREKELDRREKELDRRQQDLDERERIVRESELMWAKRDEEQRRMKAHLVQWEAAVGQREAAVKQGEASLGHEKHRFNAWLTDELRALEARKKAAGKGKGRDAGEEMER